MSAAEPARIFPTAAPSADSRPASCVNRDPKFRLIRSRAVDYQFAARRSIFPHRLLLILTGMLDPTADRERLEAAIAGCCSAACTCEGHATWLSNEADQPAANPRRTSVSYVEKLCNLQRCQPGQLANLRRQRAELYAAERPANEEGDPVTTPKRKSTARSIRNHLQSCNLAVCGPHALPAVVVAGTPQQLQLAVRVAVPQPPQDRLAPLLRGAQGLQTRTGRLSGMVTLLHTRARCEWVGVGRDSPGAGSPSTGAGGWAAVLRDQ